VSNTKTNPSVGDVIFVGIEKAVFKATSLSSEAAIFSGLGQPTSKLSKLDKHFYKRVSDTGATHYNKRTRFLFRYLINCWYVCADNGVWYKWKGDACPNLESIPPLATIHTLAGFEGVQVLPDDCIKFCDLIIKFTDTVSPIPKHRVALDVTN